MFVFHGNCYAGWRELTRPCTVGDHQLFCSCISFFLASQGQVDAVDEVEVVDDQELELGEDGGDLVFRRPHGKTGEMKGCHRKIQAETYLSAR
jgi:hypothetical protein